MFIIKAAGSLNLGSVADSKRSEAFEMFFVHEPVGEETLGIVCGEVKHIIQLGCWTRRMNPHTGAMFRQSDFKKFVESSYPEGLGTTADTIERLISNDVDVLAKFRDPDGRNGFKNDTTGEIVRAKK